MSSTKVSSVRSKLLLYSGNLSRLIFVAGNRGSVVVSGISTKLKKLDVPKVKKDKLFAEHVTQVCKAHNRAILSFLQQAQGGARPTTEGWRENIGHNVHVRGYRERNTRL